ncbi:hypothetical protein OCU04_008631 [Sclerotinia nivalis]|uniref:NACHT domain-containing protein n=1 Tax=Sclerotinia nivalis TaxID=352851 RepID=A0A9X0AIG8_9HELO|nr:hypothetical protein OCU04_008631 [Sclerotinia nivalis]
MEVLGGASSVIAVIELSAKVAGLCLQYCKNVKKAKGDIEYLLKELNRLDTTLKGAQQLLESPNGKKLETSQHLHSGLQSCYLQLEKLYAQLEETLNVGKRHQVMSRIGIRALQWPFQSTDINTIIRNFKNYRDDLSVALTIDQTTQILDINQTLVFSNLPTAKNAAFESHANEHNAQCHPETRVDLRRDIMTWAEDSQSECIFWLNGMAGTGKSTISRTVAQSFAGKGILGGSFFFKRGERDRGNAALLFTSIAAQLVNKMPVFAASVKDAIDVDHALSTKTLKEQFEQLILKPLACLNEHPRKFKKVVLVIDALDECEGDNDIKVIIHLLSQAKLLESVQLKTFVTSRPELPIRLGFNSIRGEYQDIVLHKIPAPIIEHDITAFLEYELSDIRKEYNIQMPDIQHLPSDWPGCEIIQKLVQMAVPLFIFAATTCRFIKDPAWSDPIGQLNKILGYRNQYTEVDKLDATYRPILDQLLIDKVEPARESIVQDFRLIVGSIVLLAEPLSIKFLARLLNLQESKIYGRLN